LKIVIEAPDVYTAAATLINQKFFSGRGDRNAFFKAILDSDPKTIPDLFRKLMLCANIEFYGRLVYKDKSKNKEQPRVRR